MQSLEKSHAPEGIGSKALDAEVFTSKDNRAVSEAAPADPEISLIKVVSANQFATIIPDSGLPNYQNPFVRLTGVTPKLGNVLLNLFESRSYPARITFRGKNGIIELKMPTTFHGGVIEWIIEQTFKWRLSSQLTDAESQDLCRGGNPTITMTHGNYTDDRKVPDFTMQPRAQLPDIIPTVSMEVGWAQSYASLQDNAVLLLEGGGPIAQRCILVHFTKGRNMVQCELEMWGKNGAGRALCIDTWDIFPAPAPNTPQAAKPDPFLLRSEIFGQYVHPGQNPTDQLPLNLDRLRIISTAYILAQGLVPRS
ncbi:hypothetical protein N7495_003168 [Penicillium taxi]|uniref:uncharacterized protein n=1 Tax=Penicillium taxi TaxID=168475 RepID=UPI0025458037|nr:uncharacterized protein N7495_003168 [Penicillium taxi]KAJ5902640.1 hypothetical protein N7495_003168 [Penicillium taxi]